MRETAEALEKKVTPRWVWRAFDLNRTADGGIGFTSAALTLTGDLAERMLGDCERAALLVCTLGAGYDALFRAWEKRDMARAVIMDACGSALTEAGCDGAEEEIRVNCSGWHLTDRFSPGYGDLPLGLQKALVRAADAERRLGVTVTETDLLVPVKTVTAVIGLSRRPQPARIRGCGYCALRESCVYRKEGSNCGASA